jgi:hypothetical protein
MSCAACNTVFDRQAGHRGLKAVGKVEMDGLNGLVSLIENHTCRWCFADWHSWPDSTWAQGHHASRWATSASR